MTNSRPIELGMLTNVRKKCEKCEDDSQYIRSNQSTRLAFDYRISCGSPLSFLHISRERSRPKIYLSRNYFLRQHVSFTLLSCNGWERENALHRRITWILLDVQRLLHSGNYVRGAGQSGGLEVDGVRHRYIDASHSQYRRVQVVERFR